MRGQRELLVYHCDACSAGFEWIGRAVWLAVEPHSPGVGLDGAGKDLHQSALAGAVLTYESEHAACAHLDTDIVKCNGGAEAFGHPLHFQS